jgi:hypothetical protein
LNDREDPVQDCTYEAKLITVQGKTLAEKSGPAVTAANSSSTIGRIEYVLPGEMSGKTFFVSVRLRGHDGTTVSDALYPIAVTGAGSPDVSTNIFAEMGLMPPVTVGVAPARPAITMAKSATGSCDLTLSNPTEQLAFFVRVRLLEESETLRTGYSDNYVSLLPGESKTVTVTLQSRRPESLPARLRFEVSGWNTPVRTVDVNLARR